MHGFVTFVANYGLAITLVGVLVAWLSLDGMSDKKQFLLQALIGGIVAILLARVASWLYYNPRPFVVGHFTPYFPHPINNGFPSDHTLFTSYLAFLVLSYNRKLGVALLAVAVAVGLARVTAGVHHIIDILGAFAISGIAKVISSLALKHQRSWLNIRKTLGKSAPTN